MCIYIYIYTCVYIYMYIHIYICIYIYIYMFLCTCDIDSEGIYMNMCLCIWHDFHYVYDVYVQIESNIWYIYIYIYIYTYIYTYIYIYMYEWPKLHTNLRCQRPVQYTQWKQRYLMAPLKAAASTEIRNMPLGLPPSIAWKWRCVLLVAAAVVVVVVVVSLRRQEVHVHHDSSWCPNPLWGAPGSRRASETDSRPQRLVGSRLTIDGFLYQLLGCWILGYFSDNMGMVPRCSDILYENPSCKLTQ